MINAVYGGLMTHRARASGAVGTIVDGRIRDLQEHREMNFPVRLHTRLRPSTQLLDV
jgi:regulator of RNase E activity RraA